MTFIKNYPKYLTQIFICCLIIVYGCASRIPVAKFEIFKESSESLLDNTISTYARIERLQKRFTVATAPDSEINRDTFKPQIEGQSFDLTPELRFREAAFKVFVEYVAVLHAFSEKDYMAKVDKATQRLAGSMKNLIKTSNTLSRAEVSKAAGIFAMLINKMSRELIKQKKKTALKQVMDMAQPDIEQLSKLIVGSNIKIKSTLEIMLNQIIAHANGMRPDYGTIERFHYDMEIADVITEVDQIESSLESMNSAISKIPPAHREIRSELDKKQTTLESLRALIQEAQKAQKFYRSLNN